MDATDIQKIVLRCIAGKYYRIVADTTYAVSDQPDDESAKEHEKPTFYLEADPKGGE